MARKYRQDLDGLPLAAAHNWSLLKQFEDLLRPYVEPGALIRFTAEDPRGSYNAETIDDLQAEAKKQDEPPNTISIQLLGDDRLLLLILPKGGESSGYVEGADEPYVTHVSTRIRKLLYLDNPPPDALEAGATFGVVEQEPEWRQVWPEPDDPPEPSPTFTVEKIQGVEPSRRPSFWGRHAGEITKTVVAGLILAGIVWLVSWVA